MIEWLLLGYGVLGTFVPLTATSVAGYLFTLGGVGALVWLRLQSKARPDRTVECPSLAGDLLGGGRR
jgi:hypothetical protein